MNCPSFFIKYYGEQLTRLNKFVDWLSNYKVEEETETSNSIPATETEIEQWTTELPDQCNSFYKPLFDGINTLLSIQNDFGAIVDDFDPGDYFGGALIVTTDKYNAFGFCLSVGQGSELSAYQWCHCDLQKLSQELWHHVKIYTKDEILELAKTYIASRKQALAKVQSDAKVIMQSYEHQFFEALEKEKQQKIERRRQEFADFAKMIADFKQHKNVHVNKLVIEDGRLIMYFTDDNYKQFTEFGITFDQMHGASDAPFTIEIYEKLVKSTPTPPTKVEIFNHFDVSDKPYETFVNEVDGFALYNEMLSKLPFPS